jgi:hypothetical protein
MTFSSLFRSRRGGAPSPPPGGEPDDTAPVETGLPYPGYDRLDDREVIAGLSQHSQVELTAVEAYERSHKARHTVFNKLRYLRRREPVSGYDALEVKQILTIVESADRETLDRLRSYEQKFANRPAVLDPVILAQRALRAARPDEPVPAYQPSSAPTRSTGGGGAPVKGT